MKLIGMLDSPYVRRVAISLHLQNLAFEHQALSVFSAYDEFSRINPVVKAPTLVTGSGTVLMDSSLILEYAERLAGASRSLAPSVIEDFARSQRIVGLALAACEKSVQIVYERNLRPAAKQHQPWLDRVSGQLAEAYRLLEAEMAPGSGWLFTDRPLQADITSAVAFRFTREMVPEAAGLATYPRLAALSAKAEALEAFRAYPYS